MDGSTPRAFRVNELTPDPNVAYPPSHQPPSLVLRRPVEPKDSTPI